MIKNVDYQIQLIQFPNKKVRESVVKNSDDSYTIFIESSLSRNEQQESFKHAMRHILEDDFSKKDVDNIECKAHST